MIYSDKVIELKQNLLKTKKGKLIFKVYHYAISIPIARLYALKFYTIKFKLKEVRFYTIEETFDMMINQKKSLSRFGDGEISWIFKDSKGYFGQENSEELSLRLREIFCSNDKNVLIGIPDFFGPMREYSKKRIQSRNTHLAKYHQRWMSLIDENKTYTDALLTRVYNGRTDGKSEYIFNLWKKVWDNKKVIIVEGAKTRFGVGNDLLENARDVRRIIAPAENAFKSYSELLSITKQHINSDVIFLIALGPTATVLAYDIGCNNGQAIDIGHLDIEYEWYLSGATNKIPIAGKYVNETGGDSTEKLNPILLKKYNQEVIEFVLDK